jgi:hypothetical protein
MTKQDETRPPTTREACAEWEGRPIVVVLDGRYLDLRLKGRRWRVRIPYDQLLDHGFKRYGVVQQRRGFD